MRLIEGDRGKFLIELNHDELVPFYLALAAGFTANREQWGLIQRNYPQHNVRDWITRVMELLKRRFML